MPFRNRIRLPFYISKAQFPTEQNVTRLANGITRVESVVIRKTYEGLTDDLPEWVHQRLVIALSHDIVKIEGDRYFGEVARDGEYEIDWHEFMDRPLAQAKFKVEVTPFDATNSNCQSCEEANQVSLVDDTFPSTLEESETYTLDVFENDTIECYPFTATIVYFNPDFIASAEIDENGILTVETTPEFQSANGVKLVTYRVTCPNGGFDEADVYGNLDGTVEACLAPLSLNTSLLEEDSVTMVWNNPDPAPEDGYEWSLIEFDHPGVIVQSGTSSTDSQAISGLTPGTKYTFNVRSKCGEGYYSNYVSRTFTTSTVPEGCGRYQVTYGGSGPNEQFQSVTYIHCTGEQRNILLFAFQPKTICAAETSAGSPVMIIGADTINYIGLCD